MPAEARYILRPEAIESVYIMYRITGDTVWQDKGWKMFQSTVAIARTDVAFVEISGMKELHRNSELDIGYMVVSSNFLVFSRFRDGRCYSWS